MVYRMMDILKQTAQLLWGQDYNYSRQLTIIITPQTIMPEQKVTSVKLYYITGLNEKDMYIIMYFQ